MSQIVDLSAQGKPLRQPIDEQLRDLDKHAMSEEALYQLIDRKTESISNFRAALDVAQHNYEALAREHEKLLRKWDDAEINKELQAASEHLEETQQEVDLLEDEVQLLTKRIQMKKELEKKVKLELDLDSTASEGEIITRIQQLKMDNKGDKVKLDQMEKKVVKLIRDKKILEDRCEELQDDIRLRSISDQQARKQEAYKRSLALIMRRRGAAKPRTTDAGPSGKGQQPAADALKCTAISGPKSKPASKSPEETDSKSRCISAEVKDESGETKVKAVDPAVDVGRLSIRAPESRDRCVLCGQEFVGNTQWCSVHYKTCKGGHWACCGSLKDSAGCLKMPHMRIESIVTQQGQKYYLTDGKLKTIMLV